MADVKETRVGAWRGTQHFRKASFLDSVIYAFHFPSHCLTPLSLSAFHLGIYEGHWHGSSVSHHIPSLSFSSRSVGRRISLPTYPEKEIFAPCVSLFLKKVGWGKLERLWGNEKSLTFPHSFGCCVLICIMWLPSAPPLSSWCCYIRTYFVVLLSRWLILQPCQHDHSGSIWIIKK